jgi:hypothetical protein
MRSFFFSRFVLFFFFSYALKLFKLFGRRAKIFQSRQRHSFSPFRRQKKRPSWAHRQCHIDRRNFRLCLSIAWRLIFEGWSIFFVFVTWFLISLIDFDLVALVNLCAHKSTLFTDSLNSSTAHKTFTPPSISLFPSRNVIILNSSAWWEEEQELLDVLISDDASLRENRSALSLAGVYIMEPRDF